MARVLFALTSPLIRNNGINTLLRETIKVLRGAGNTVDILTDNSVDFDITGYPNRYYKPQEDTDQYADCMVNGVPDVKVDPLLIVRMRDMWHNIKSNNYDVIISNDAHSTSALIDVPNVYHFLHTSDIVAQKKCSFLSQSYLELEKSVMQRVPVIIAVPEIAKLLPAGVETVVLGQCFTERYKYLAAGPQEGISFIGEGTVRKGADHLNNLIQALPYEKFNLVLSCEIETKIMESPNITKEAFTDDNAKANFIKASKVSYCPSRGEAGMPFSYIEAALSQPVVVHKDELWTCGVVPTGAIAVDPRDATKVIAELLTKDYDNSKLIAYLDNSEKQWIEFIASKE